MAEQEIKYAIIPEYLVIRGVKYRVIDLLRAKTTVVTYRLDKKKSRGPKVHLKPGEIAWVKSATVDEIMERYNKERRSAQQFQYYIRRKYPYD